MSLLAKDNVMMLDEQQINQVWEDVAQRRASITGWLNDLAASFSAAEASFRQSIEAALQLMVADMSEIAHIDEGRLHRLTEEEVLALNMLILDNRQVSADILQQLHEHEVRIEQSRHQRWLAAFGAWRKLRSQHAVQCFCQHVQVGLSEPPACLQLFAQLRDRQEEAHKQLQQLCRKLGQLLPPHFTAKAASDWAHAANQWNARWQQEVDLALQELQAQENVLEHKVQHDLKRLHAEVIAYKGFTHQEVEQLLQLQATPVITQRREAAQQLLQQTSVFLQRQAAEWRLATEVLSSWLTSLVALYEGHKSQTKQSETAIKASLQTARQQHEQEDAQREAALDACILSVSQGSSEQALDERVDAALWCLAKIESGYRSYTIAATGMVREYPGIVRQQADMYIRCLCGILHVEPASAAAAAGPVKNGQQQQAGTTALTHHYHQQAATGQQLLEVVGGAAYLTLHDLWQALLDATPKPWQQQQEEVQPLNSPAAEQAQPAAAAAAAARAVAPLKPQQAPPDIAVAKAVAGADGTATAPADEAAQADASDRDPDSTPPCPMSSSNTALCLQLGVPAEDVQCSLQQIQVALLSDRETFAARNQGAAESWSEQVEHMLTEELDNHLRSHRPRAGRIEEEVRAMRSIELLVQGRRVDSHMRLQSKAVKDQQAMFKEAISQLQTKANTWRTKLLDYVRLLGNALSLKGVDICWREAQALKAKLDKQLAERVEELQQQVDSTCADIVAANRRFETEHLRTFQEGGSYAEENVATYKAGNAGIDDHIATQQQHQREQLAAVQRELAAGLSAAEKTIEELLPSHKQDMTLIEALNRGVEGANRKLQQQFSKNSEAIASIDVVLQQIDHNLVEAADTLSELPALTANGPAMAAAGNVEMHLLGHPRAQMHCRQLLGQVDQLRQQLLQQARVLDVLESTALSNAPISLRTTNQLLPLHETADAAPDTAAAASAAAPALAAAGTMASCKIARPGTGQKTAGGRPGTPGGARPGTPGRAAEKAGSRPGSPNRSQQSAKTATTQSGEPAADQAGSEPDVLPLATNINQIISATKLEVEAAAKAYYVAKGANRPIRYPARIAGSLHEFMAGVDAVLSGLQRLLEQHMVAAVEQLRVQAVQAQRLLEAVPTVAMSLMCQHLLSAVWQQHGQLLSDFAAKRQVLDSQSEQHKMSLHPSMLHPNRRPELEALKASEAARQLAAVELVADTANACLTLTTSQGSQLSGAFGELCKLLLALLDSCVLLPDLVPAPEGDDVLARLPQRSLMQLQRLALAQADATPIGTATPAVPVGKAIGKGNKGGEPAGAEGATGTGRPFYRVTWQLAAGDYGLKSLGWSQEDQQATASRTQNAVEATAVVKAAAGPPAPASKAPAAVPQQQDQQRPQAEQDAVATVTGLDTPCHRAAIRAHRAAISSSQQALAAAVGDLKKQLYQWLGQEQQWMAAWEKLINELDTV